MAKISNTALEVGASPTLPEVVYRALRQAILNGSFIPGQMLRQDDVAARLGVSRSPLREALPRLEAEGILVLHPRRGYSVATLDPREIAEVFDLRSLLEAELARRSIVKRTATDIARVYTISAEMAELTLKNDDASLSQWFELNMKLHDTFLAPAECPHHMRALQHSRNLIEAYIRTEVRLTGDLREAQQEHCELAQAFVIGDIDQFLACTREHSQHTRDRLLAALQTGSAAISAQSS
jgi:DNA-binding GntR family transcriptional regulator